MDSRGWTSSVVGLVSRWIDLDAKCPRARLAAEKAFKQEIAWATHLSVGAVLLPAVRSHQQCANYARVLNQAASQAQYLQVRAGVDAPAVLMVDQQLLQQRGGCGACWDAVLGPRASDIPAGAAD